MERKQATRSSALPDGVFEEVFFDGLLEFLFSYLYPVKGIHNHTLACGQVNSRWRKLFEHPLVLFGKGQCNESLLRFPPTYYLRSGDKWSILVGLDGMRKQIEAVTDEDKIQEQFIMDNMFLHYFCPSSIKCKNERVNKKVEELRLRLKLVLETRKERGNMQLYCPIYIGRIGDLCTDDELLEANRLFRHCSSEVVKRCKKSREFCTKAVLVDRRNLEDIPDELKTAEMCEDAVRSFPELLLFTPVALRTQKLCNIAVEGGWPKTLLYAPDKFKTEEMCRQAVMDWPNRVRILPKRFQTKEMYMLALQHPTLDVGDIPKELMTDPDIMQCPAFVSRISQLSEEDRTKEICVKAVSRNGTLLEFVPEHLKSRELCVSALQCRRAIQFLPKAMRTNEMYEIAVNIDSNALLYVPEKALTENLCRIALQASKDYNSAIDSMRLAPEKLTPEICLLAVQKDGRLIRLVPIDMRTREICLIAMQKGGELTSVPEKMRDEEMCRAAVKGSYINYIRAPKEYQTEEMEKLTLTGLHITSNMFC